MLVKLDNFRMSEESWEKGGMQRRARETQAREGGGLKVTAIQEYEIHVTLGLHNMLVVEHSRKCGWKARLNYHASS